MQRSAKRGRRIDSNPPAGRLWIEEKGSPWRSKYEFEQIKVDQQAFVECFDKRVLVMAKSVGAGLQEMYGI